MPIDLSELENDGILNPWQGKSVLTYGDSISAINNGTRYPPYPMDDTWNTSWAGIIANVLGFNRVYGRGVGGSSTFWNLGDLWYWYANSEGEYVGDDDDPQPPNTTAHPQFACSWSRITKMIPANYEGLILAMTGLNDWGANAPLGDDKPMWVNGNNMDTDWATSPQYLGGDFNITTFSGAMASMMMKIQIHAPNATFVNMTPISGRQNDSGSPYDQMQNSSQLLILDYAQRVKDVSQFMSIPVIDVFGTWGVNQINRAHFMADVIHPYTLNGKKALARAVISGLTGIYPSFGYDIIPPNPTVGQGYWINYNTEVQTNFDGTSEWISGTTFNQPSWRTQAKEVFIPEGIVETGPGVFSGGTYLEKVTLPSTITTMSMNQFSDCLALLDLTVLATTPPIVGSFGINIGGPNTRIYVPAGSVAAYKTAQGWSTFSAIIFAIPDPEPEEYGYWIHKDTNVKTEFGSDDPSITGSTFSSPSWKNNASEIRLPDVITHINNDALSNSLDLVTLILPKSVTFVGTNVLSNTPSFKNLYVYPEIPPSLTSLGVDVGSFETQIKVEGNSFDEYRLANGWSQYYDKLFVLNDLTSGSRIHNGYTSQPTPLLYDGQTNIIIENLIFDGVFDPNRDFGSCLQIRNCSNVIIRNCRFINLDNANAITISGSSNNITVYNCDFINIWKGVIVDNCTGGIRVFSNDFYNIKGHLLTPDQSYTPDFQCQAIQFRHCTGSNMRFQDNAIENIVGESAPEDLVNAYNCNFDLNNPLIIKNNLVRGGGPSMSSGGFLLGDSGGSNGIIEDNILVNPGHYGIGLVGGANQVLRRNLVYGAVMPWSNVGIQVVDYHPDTPPNGNYTVEYNRVNWRNSNNQQNDYWVHVDSRWPVGWDTNVWNDSTVTPNILPKQLIGI